MHTHRLNGCPHIVAHTDGAQMTGPFYLHAPLDYTDALAQGPAEEKDYRRLLAGYAVIILSMERIRQIAEEPGAADDIVTLTGPDRECDRYSNKVTAWLAGQDDGDLPVHEVQIKRTELRQLWIAQLAPEVISRIEALESTAGNEYELVSLLSRLRTMTGPAWFEQSVQEHMERHTPPAPGSAKPGRL